MIDWPQTLIEDLGRRRCVVVIGSGVSRHSLGKNDARPPTWKDFLIAAQEDCPQQPIPDYLKDAIQNGDLLHACEWLKKRFDDDWPKYLRQKFQKPQFSPSELHYGILNLDSRVVFSLNFDDIYERTAHEVQAGSHIVKHFYDSDVSEFRRGDGRYIVKLHGSLNSPDKLIFTQRDYSEARTKYSSFYDAFDAAIMTHSVVFIGAGYSDPDVNLLLENQNFSFPTSSPHYFLTSEKKNDDLRESLRRNRNLKVIQYDPIDENHSGLTKEILELVDLVELHREQLKKTTNW